MGHFLCRFLRLCCSLLGKDLKYLHIWNIRSNFARSKIWGQQNKNVLKIKIMKKIFTVLVMLMVALTTFAQLAYNHVFNESDFNNPSTIVGRDEGPKGQAWADGIRLGGADAGATSTEGWNWDEKFVVIALANGVPDKISFAASNTSILPTQTFPSGAPYYKVFESPDNANWNEVWSIRTQSQNAVTGETVYLSKSTRYIKLYYQGNFAAIYKNVRVSERISMGTANPATIDFGTVKVDDVFSDNSVSIGWTNVVATATSTDEHFTAEGFGEIGGYDQTAHPTITLLTHEAGTFSATITWEGRNKSTSVEVTATVEKYDQTISLDMPETALTTDELPVATASSGLDVEYSIEPEGVVAYENGAFTIIKDGEVTITASQAGNYKYNQAPSVTKIVTISKVTPEVTAPTLTEITYPEELSETQMQGGTASVEGQFAISDDLGTVLMPGTHTVNILFTPANTDWYSTVPTTAELTVIAPTLYGEKTIAVCGDEKALYYETEYAEGEHTVQLPILNSLGGDSIVTLTVVVNQPSAFVDEPREIIYGAQGTWNGYDLSTYAIGPHTLTYTTTNAVDCDSVVTMQLTVLAPETRGELEVFTCPGVPYEFMEQEFEPDFYTIRMPGANCYGGDSILELTVSEYPTYDIHETIEMNDNETREWQGESLSGYDEGTYNDIRKEYTTVNGCDSIYSLTLIVHPTYLIEENKTIMEGQGDTWHGKDLNGYLASQTPYTVYDSLETVFGGDSVYVLTLTVTARGVTYGEYRAAFCDGDEITFEEVTYSTPFDGNITVAEKNVYGGDSIVHLIVTVYPKYDIIVEDEMYVGEHKIWNGYDLAEWEFDEGNWELPVQRLRSVHGCDSIVHTYIEVLPLPTSIYEYDAVICDNETYSDENFSEVSVEQEYRRTLRNFMGGDSIIIFNLTVYPTYAISEEDEIDLTHSEYVWHEQVFPLTGEGTFELVDSLTTVTGCDSVHTLTLRVYKLDQELTWLQEGATVDVGDKIELVAPTTTSGLEAELSFSDENLYTIEENGTYRYIVFTQAGELTVTASQPGNTAYNAAEPVSVTFTINPVTGLEEIVDGRESIVDSRKILHEGQILILRNDKVYDISGRKVK